MTIIVFLACECIVLHFNFQFISAFVYLLQFLIHSYWAHFKLFVLQVYLVYFIMLQLVGLVGPINLELFINFPRLKLKLIPLITNLVFVIVVRLMANFVFATVRLMANFVYVTVRLMVNFVFVTVRLMARHCFTYALRLPLQSDFKLLFIKRPTSATTILALFLLRPLTKQHC